MINNISEIIIYFTLYSFTGWVCESLYCSINEKKWVNRGFLTGPFCPVYGFGGLIVVYILAPFKDNIPVLFVLGMISTTALEYLTSVVLEKIFDTKWWDYTPNKFNINGRVCLSFSIIFGVLSVLGVKLLYRPFHLLAEAIPVAARPWVAAAVLVMFISDAANTAVAVLGLNAKLKEINESLLYIRQKLEGISERRKDTVLLMINEFAANMENEKYESVKLAVQNKLEELRKQISGVRFGQRRIMAAFPNMNSKKYKESLAQLKEKARIWGGK